MSAHFEIYQDDADPPMWRWRLRASNGEPVASGESYGSEHDVFRAIGDVVGAAKGAAESAIERVDSDAVQEPQAVQGDDGEGRQDQTDSETVG